ncbi:uncharacterized protein LOC121885001 isoform X1 [Scomber scombrus]|uniref:Uncharacterized protein LOC121885001 isoform X1 n=1 Tax=Scomber scombrus TaxID=13677 RepID=A0AAV1P294_SCOSC
MAATAAVRPPQAHPGPDGGNGSTQNPAPSSHPQHHVPAQPVFYVHAQHPPPFFHYQWPMPFSYNPFTGFPGMGYGMVMPPFPPPHPYMEAPPYILPHPHIPPVDYRLLLHAPNAPYQNPNQTRRVRHPYSFPARETVNSEVQTEPLQRGGGSPLVSTDSGHGAASSSLSSSRSSLHKHGSPSSPPSSSHSTLKKQRSPKAKNHDLPSRQKKKEDFEVDRTYSSSSIKQGFNISHPTGLKTVQPCIRATAETQNEPKDSLGKENAVFCRNTHCNIWSVSSTDSLTPVCNSSQREDKVVKQRRLSVPDILMRWGGGTPQAAILKMTDKVLPQNEDQLLSSEVEYEKSVYQSLTETKNGPVVADGADAEDNAENDAEGILSSKDTEPVFPVGLVGSVQHSLPYNDELLHSLNKSQKLHELENDSETNPHEETIEIIPYQTSFNSSHMKRMNESVWSVESLAPFVPKDWLMQNSMFESEVIIEMTEEAKDGLLSPQNDNLIVKASKERRQSRRFSSVFNSPAEKLILPKMPELETEIDASDMGRLSKQGQSVAPSEKDPVALSTCLLSKNHSSTPNQEDVGEKGSSEPEANQSPNQETYIVIKQLVKSPIQESDTVTEKQVEIPCSPEQQETLASNSTAGKKILSTNHSDNGDNIRVEEGVYGNEDGQLRNEQLRVPVAHPEMVEVSPSKGHLVDCGIQCTELQEQKCLCEDLKTNMGPNGKYMKNGKAEGFSINGHMQKHHKRHGQRRNNRQEKHNSPPDAYNSRYYGKPGKPRGGNGRYPQ